MADSFGVEDEAVDDKSGRPWIVGITSQPDHWVLNRSTGNIDRFMVVTCEFCTEWINKGANSLYPEHGHLRGLGEMTLMAI